MAYWLVKCEPHECSLDELKTRPKSTVGVVPMNPTEGDFKSCAPDGAGTGGGAGVRILTLDVDTQMGAGHLDALNSQFLASPRGGSCIR